MFKYIHDTLLSFDIEWAPDKIAGHLFHNTPLDSPASEWEAYRALWQQGGATPDNPQPYLKTVLCRVVSIAGILREYHPANGEVTLKLISLPSQPQDTAKWTEAHLIDAFLKAIGKKKPQLVAYNSNNADLPILIQRAIINGLHQPEFCQRPNKPWEGVDYFSAFSDHNLDLAPCLGKGKNTPSLHEIASLSGIPGKMDTSGDAVAEMWHLKKIKEIVDYNEFDAFTTHLLWARMAHFSGLLSPSQYQHEQELVQQLLQELIDQGKTHLTRFVEEWQRLQQIANSR